jgi:hypothetical protein
MQRQPNLRRNYYDITYRAYPDNIHYCRHSYPDHPQIAELCGSRLFDSYRLNSTVWHSNLTR